MTTTRADAGLWRCLPVRMRSLLNIDLRNDDLLPLDQKYNVFEFISQLYGFVANLVSVIKSGKRIFKIGEKTVADTSAGSFPFLT